MHKGAGLAVGRVFFAILALVAIAVQLADLAGKGILNPISYFTIDSNLIAVALLLVVAARQSADSSRTLDIARGGAVVYMS